MLPAILLIGMAAAEPDDDAFHVRTKTFLVAMRRHHGDTNGNALREYLDPDWLKTHKLADADLAVKMAPVDGIHNYELADDRRTMLCFVNTKDGHELILIRFVLRDGRLFLSPAKAPDAKTGAFAPWILRTKWK